MTDTYFQTYGCSASQACGQFICEWTIGKAVEQLVSITEADVLHGTGPMPLSREHYPGLAIRVLQCACIVNMPATEEI